MAGAGYKLFTTGSVLTAADVNQYLNEQTVMVFANAAARTTALSGVLAEGMVSYLKDTDALEIYSGSAWVGYGSGDITGVTAGTGISGGGTSGTVTITNSMATEITAAGDIIVGTGSGTFDNLPIGTTGQVLTADTTVSPYKVKWATTSSSPSFVGARAYNSTGIVASSATWTAITLNSENYDTDAIHSTTTNTSRMTIPTGKSGKWLINMTVTFEGNATNCNVQTAIYKNGSSTVLNRNGDTVTSGERDFMINTVLDLTAGDYLETYVRQDTGSNKNFYMTGSQGFFCVTYLGA